MAIQKDVKANSCIDLAEEGCIYVLLCLKSDVLVRNLGSKSIADVE